MPTLITTIAIYFLFAKLHLVGSIVGLLLAHLVMALSLVIGCGLGGSLRNVDIRPEQAASSLGAGPTTAFQKITLPTIKSGILTAAFFAFLASFDDVVFALFLSGTTAITLPKGIWDSIRWEIDPTVAAVSTLMIMVSIVLLAGSQLATIKSRRAGGERGEE